MGPTYREHQINLLCCVKETEAALTERNNGVKQSSNKIKLVTSAKESLFGIAERAPAFCLYNSTEPWRDPLQIFECLEKN